MSTMRTVATRASIAARLGHAGYRLTAALGEEYRYLALDILAPAFIAGHGDIRLGHGSDDFKLVFTILADIFVNGHGYLNPSYCNSFFIFG